MTVEVDFLNDFVLLCLLAAGLRNAGVEGVRVGAALSVPWRDGATRPTIQPADRKTDRPMNQPTDRPNDSRTDRSIDRPTDEPTD